MGNNFYESEKENETKKKVTKMDNVSLSINATKVLTIICLVSLLCSRHFIYKKAEKVNQDFDSKVEVTQPYQESIADGVAEKEKKALGDAFLGNVYINNRYLFVARPTTEEVNGNVRYIAPVGYVLDGELCYRQVTTFQVPKGYVLDGTGRYAVKEDDAPTYSVPEGYILMGDKGVDIRLATKVVQDNGEVIYIAPEGYVLSGGFCYKTVDATLMNGKGNVLKK